MTSGEDDQRIMKWQQRWSRMSSSMPSFSKASLAPCSAFKVSSNLELSCTVLQVTGAQEEKAEPLVAHSGVKLSIEALAHACGVTLRVLGPGFTRRPNPQSTGQRRVFAYLEALTPWPQGATR